jgi:NodT family efflux transporter outer membrane factor (OMF) lipoprotein
VEVADVQNLTVQTAGMRVIEAQARRAVTIGNLFPQQQELTASYARSVASQNAFGAAPGLLARSSNSWQAGFDTAWELDLWGKFRRAVEAADADLLAASASYGDVLVSLVAEVASTYVSLRVLDERLAVAHDNVRVQHDSLQIARIRFEEGSTSDLDVEQATTLVRDTEATIPQLGILRRQAVDALCVLLGLPPQQLTELLGEKGGLVPQVPATVTVGIPADLLQRRPDVRAAEQAAAAQSARIGVATADLLPAFSLAGQIGLNSQSVAAHIGGRACERVGEG